MRETTGPYVQDNVVPNFRMVNFVYFGLYQEAGSNEFQAMFGNDLALLVGLISVDGPDLVVPLTDADFFELSGHERP